jgi:predicted transcriptional regulator
MTRAYAKRSACIDCGQPTGRPNTRCAACARIARSARNKEYQQRYHVEHRPSPQPRPQRDPALPPYGEIVTDDERIQCHVCGTFYGSLVTHIRTHGLDADRYKERFDLPRTCSLLGPAAAAKQRAAAIARNQGEIGRANIPRGSSRPRGLPMRLGSRINARDGQRAPAAKKATTGRREPDAPLD